MSKKTLISRVKSRTIIIVGLFIVFGALLAAGMIWRQKAYPTVIVKSISASEDGLHLYENKNKAFTARFGFQQQGKVEHLVAYEKDEDTSLTMQLLETNEGMKAYKTTADKDGQKVDVVKFDNIYPSTNTYYQITNTRIKELFLLQDQKAPAAFHYSLVTKGVELEEKDGGYIFKQGRSIAFAIAPLFMQDGKGALSYEIKSDLKFIKEENGEKIYELTITPSAQWLKDPERQYPVIVDPSIVHDTGAEFQGGSFNRVELTSSNQLSLGVKEFEVDQNTVALWHMNETANGTCNGGGDMCDATTSNIHGSSNGSSIDTVNKKYGAAARSFSGGNYIYIADNNNLSFTNRTFTVEAWIRTTRDYSGTLGTIASKGGGPGSWEYALWIPNWNPNRVSFSTWEAVSGNGDTANGTTAINDGNWHHVMGTADNANLKIYVDGVLEGIAPLRYPMINGTSPLNIGRRPDGNFYFTGQIDEVRISNIARTPEGKNYSNYGVYTSSSIDLGVHLDSIDSIQWSEHGVATGNGESPKDSTGLVAQWNFNEASGTTAANSAGAGSCGGTPDNCNGSLTGFASTGSQDAAVGSGWTANNKRWGSGAVMLDGSNDSITITDNNAVRIMNAPFSVSSWVKFLNIPVTGSGNHKLMFGKVNSFWLAGNYSDAGCNTNKYSFVVFNGSSWVCANSTNVIDTNWHLLTGTFDGSKISFYLDGKLHETKSVSSISNPSTALNLGSNAGAYGMAGNMDAVAFYSRALPADEILANYNAANIELQTRTSADGLEWEEWKPIGSEAQMASMDSGATSGSGYASSNDANMKVEGTASQKIELGRPGCDANTVALWHMEETSGSGAYLKDSCGTNHGTPSGTSVVDGWSGKGRSFNGNSNFVSIPYSASGDVENHTAITLSGWVKSAPSAYLTLWSNEYSGAGTSMTWFYISNAGKIGFRAYQHGLDEWWWETSASVVSAGDWHHIAITHVNGQDPKIYLDGQSQSLSILESNNNKIRHTSDYPFWIGRDPWATWSTGSIDELRIDNNARTADEIAEAYRAGREQRITKTITTTDLSDDTKLPFYVASDKLGTNFEAMVGESAFANYEPDANTVGLWHMEEGAGSGAYIKDSSSQGNHGTPTGTSVSEGKFGKGRSFNGTSDYISVPDANSLDLTTDGTVEAWINLDQIKNSSIVKRANNGYFLGINDTGKIIWGKNAVDELQSNSIMQAGQWYHIAATRTGGINYIYVNGTLDNSSAKANFDALASPIEIGGRTDNSMWTDGTLDEVRISNIARTADEIRQAYEIGKRTHQITVDFKARLDSGNLITDSSDKVFTVDETIYYANHKARSADP